LPCFGGPLLRSEHADVWVVSRTDATVEGTCWTAGKHTKEPPRLRGEVLACADLLSIYGNPQRDPLASVRKVLAREPTTGTVQRDPLASARKVLACAFQGTVQRDPPRLGGEGSGVHEPRKGTQQRDPSRLGGEILARGSLLCHAGNRAMGDLSSLGKGGSSACGDRKDHLGRGLLRSTIAKFLARPMILFWCGPSGLRTSWLTSVRCEGGCGRPCSFQGSGASYCAGKVRASH